MRIVKSLILIIHTHNFLEIITDDGVVNKKVILQ